MKIKLLLAIALVALFVAVPFAAAAGSETGGVRLVFEKPLKIRKIRATFYLPFLDQADPRDSNDQARELECEIAVEGTKGPATATGAMSLRLLDGGDAGEAPWRGSELIGGLDPDGTVAFSGDVISPLVAEADSAGREPSLFELSYAGGKGKKATQVTIDCTRRAAED